MAAMIQEQIEARNADMMAAFEQADVSKLQDMYCADAEFMLPNAPKMAGREAIGAGFGGMFEAGLTRLNLTCQNVRDFEGFALELGDYSLQVGDGTTVDKGHYQVLWKSENGRWQISQDIVTSSEPVQQA